MLKNKEARLLAESRGSLENERATVTSEVPATSEVPHPLANKCIPPKTKTRGTRAVKQATHGIPWCIPHPRWQHLGLWKPHR